MKLEDVSIRPERNSKSVLMHFEGFNFITLQFAKGMSILEVYDMLTDKLTDIDILIKREKSNVK